MHTREAEDPISHAPEQPDTAVEKSHHYIVDAVVIEVRDVDPEEPSADAGRDVNREGRAEASRPVAGTYRDRPVVDATHVDADDVEAPVLVEIPELETLGESSHRVVDR